MALDPNEAPEGTKAVEGDECRRCVFRDIATFDDCEKRKCTAQTRIDRTGCHFEALTVLATAIWPYDDMGTPVEVT